MRELVRRAALFAAEADEAVVADRHLAAALDELVVAGGELTRSLLGARRRAGQDWAHEVLHGKRER